MLHRDRALAARKIRKLVSNWQRIHNSRACNLGLMRIKRRPYTANSVTLSNINRYIRADNNNRALKGEMRRFNISSNRHESIVDISTRRLLLLRLISSSMISNRLHTYTDDHKRNSRKRALITHKDATLWQRSITVLKVNRSGTSALNDICHQPTTSNCRTINAAHLVHNGALLGVQRYKIQLRVAMSIVNRLHHVWRIRRLLRHTRTGRALINRWRYLIGVRILWRH